MQYLVDLIYPAYAERGVLQDMTTWVNDPAWKSERDAIAPFAWNLAIWLFGSRFRSPAEGADTVAEGAELTAEGSESAATELPDAGEELGEDVSAEEEARKEDSA